MPASILLIEDDPQAVRHISGSLGTNGFEVVSVDTVGDGLRHLTTHTIDCVLLDYRLPDGNGLSALRAISRGSRDVPVIVVTGAGSEEVAVEAMKLGAADYVVKHGCYVDRLAAVVREVLGRHLIQSTATPPQGMPARLPQEVRARYRTCGILGESAALDDAISLAERAARTDAAVLLEGETGTGKELFAHAIHRHGARSQGPFVAVNCAAVPEALLESELFGHVRGAFSGADRDRHGVFEEASRGTLLLDEECDTPLAIQAKVLRTLQDGEVRPVGANRGRRIDVRVVAAANSDLRAAVASGRFRLDLFHRLNVFPIRLPPLRQRHGDVPLLARHFLVTLAEREGKAPLSFDPAVLQLMERYSWPGNVRELRNEVHRLVLCAEPGGRIGVSMLPRLIGKECSADDRRLREIVRDVERATIAARLREHGYRRAVTARSLGLSREGLWQKLRALGVRVPPPDVDPAE